MLQRGRFAVIPEEPQGSPAQGTSAQAETDRNRSPSPEWDFDIEVSTILVYFQHSRYIFKYSC